MQLQSPIVYLSNKKTLFSSIFPVFGDSENPAVLRMHQIFELLSGLSETERSGQHCDWQQRTVFANV